MQAITSRDGTRIAFSKSGQGPPLLLVHGSTADHTTTWRSVLVPLEQHFTVYAMDRRGRGESGDAAEYDLHREAEDVAAVLDSIDDSVNIVGHSHGALCALEAALVTTNSRRLILYEGVPLHGADDVDPRVIARMEAELGAEDIEGVLVTLLRDVAQMSGEAIALLRAQRAAWQVRLANARTIPRELRAYENYTFDPVRFAAMRTPTLMLVGGDSPQHELTNANGIADALPRARVSVLPGQHHVAMHTAPALFVDEVVQFLTVD